MTKVQFFDAFGEIDSAFILTVDEILEQTDKKVVPFARRKVISAALIAAILVGLLTITAYATGFFGLQSRLIKDPGPTVQTQNLPEEAEKTLNDLRGVHHRDYISLNGVNGSSEYQAAAEWLTFKGAYAEQMAAEQLEKGESYYEWRDLDRSFAPDEEAKEICRLYQVWDAAMWARLQEIADKYELQLHTSRTVFPGNTREHGLYEDGSFVAFVDSPNIADFSYVIYLERKGSLPADDLTAIGTDEYEEWEYVNAFGNTVSIAARNTSQEEEWITNTILIFYNGDDASITLKTAQSHSANGNTDDKAEVESFIDLIDFEAVTAAGTQEAIMAILKGATP